MDQQNRNNNTPFGSYRYSADETNRRNAGADDTWTPISTGVPLQTPNKPQSGKPAQQKKTAARKPAQRKTARKKTAARKPAQQKTDTPAAAQRPVVRDTQRRTQQTLQREQRAYDNDKRRFEKDHAYFEKGQNSGRSRDEIRRRKARRKKRNKKLRAVLTVVIVMALAGLCALIYCVAYGAPINKINVSGKSIYTSEQIIDASGIRTGDNMLRIRKSEVSRAVCEELPYISGVKVEFKLPDTLLLKVTQAQEKYLIVGKGGYLCLDENGKVLSLKKKKTKEGQYRLEGFEQQTAREGDIYKPEGDNVNRYDVAKQIIAQLEKNDLKQANLLQMGDMNKVLVQFDGRINIYLNGNDYVKDSNDLEEKIALVAGVIKNEISQNSKGYIDARFEGRVFFNEGTMTIDG